MGLDLRLIQKRSTEEKSEEKSAIVKTNPRHFKHNEIGVSNCGGEISVEKERNRI